MDLSKEMEKYEEELLEFLDQSTKLKEAVASARKDLDATKAKVEQIGVNVAEELARVKTDLIIIRVTVDKVFAEVDFVGAVGHRLANYFYRLKEAWEESKTSSGDSSPPVVP